MIYEYAVEPALVASWALNGSIGLAAQFGRDHRRLVSDFPKGWEGEIASVLLEHFEWDDGRPDYIEANQQLSALLFYMKDGMIDRDWKTRQRPWLEQALDANTAEPFHAILSSQEASEQPAVITPRVVDKPFDSRWYLPTIDVTAKTAEAMADQLESLLRTANQIILVDPYFDPRTPAYCDVLRLIVDRALRGRAQGRSRPALTIMSGVNERQRGSGARPVEIQHLNEAGNRCKSAAESLGRCMPLEMSLTFQCIVEFCGGDQVHNRYVLTDVAGACIPYGTLALGKHVFDDITLLYKGQYKSRWRQYGKAEGLKIIGSPVVIQGSTSWVKAAKA